MKSLLFLLALIPCMVLAQSEPVTRMKGSSDGAYKPSPNIVVPNHQATRANSTTARIETGNDNLLKNPSFEATTVGGDWTAVNGSCGSSSGVTVDGNVNCSFTSSGTNWSLSQCSTTNSPRLAGQEMENSVWLGSASTSDPIWVCPGTNGSYPTPSVANGCMQYTNIGSIQLLKNYFLGDSASTSNCIRISGSNSGTTVGIDKAYTGLRTNSEVSGELNTPWVPYTPTFAGVGTVTGANFFWKRKGQDLYIRGRGITGTTVASGMSMSLPTIHGGITIDTSAIVAASQIVGSAVRGATTSADPYTVLAFTSAPSLLFFGREAVGTFSALDGSSLYGNNENFGINVGPLPIAEWRNNINAFSTKCDDPRKCETVFSAKVSSTNTVSEQSTGASFPWLASASWSSGTLTITPTSGMFTVTPNCWGISYVQGQRVTIDTEGTSTYSFKNRANDGTANTNADVKIFCQKRGADYDNSRITQQIVQMREVPRVPGSVSSSIGSSRYYGASFGSSCTANPCQNLKPVGQMISSVGWTGSSYRVTLNRTYAKVSCTANAVIPGTGYTTSENYGENISQIDLNTAYGIAPATQSFGTVNCIGEY